MLQECIKPVKIERLPGKVGRIRIEDDGSYVQVNKVRLLYRCANNSATLGGNSIVDHRSSNSKKLLNVIQSYWPR